MLSESVYNRLECLIVLVRLIISSQPSREQSLHLVVELVDIFEMVALKLFADDLNIDICLFFSVYLILSAGSGLLNDYYRCGSPRLPSLNVTPTTTTALLLLS